MVERNLAKVDVEGSNPFSRSTSPPPPVPGILFGGISAGRRCFQRTCRLCSQVSVHGAGLIRAEKCADLAPIQAVPENFVGIGKPAKLLFMQARFCSVARSLGQRASNLSACAPKIIGPALEYRACTYGSGPSCKMQAKIQSNTRPLQMADSNFQVRRPQASARLKSKFDSAKRATFFPAHALRNGCGIRPDFKMYDWW